MHVFSYMKEEKFGDPSWIEVCEEGDVPHGKSAQFDVEGWNILLCSTPDGILAIQNQCSHMALPLDRGRILGCQIICPHHGARFDLKTGCPLAGAAVGALRTFPVMIRDGKILAEFRKKLS